MARASFDAWARLSSAGILTVERPLRDEAGEVVLGVKGKQKGKPQPDSDSALRDTENVPLADDIAAYFKREVLPHVPDAWIDEEKSKVGYEIPFNRHFYVFEPLRSSLHAIDEDLKAVSANIMKMLEELESTTDPHQVYDLRAKLDAAGYYDEFEVDRVAKIETDSKSTQAQLSAAIAPVADRLLRRYKAAQGDMKNAEESKDAAAVQMAKDALEVLILFKNDTCLSQTVMGRSS